MGSLSRRDEVLEQISATHAQLESQLALVKEAEMTEPGVNGEWSVKDILAHITWWEQHRLRQLRAEADDFDSLETTEQVNAAVFAANQSRQLAEIMAEFKASYQEVLAAIAALPEAMVEQTETYDDIASDTFRHYPEHTAMLQRWNNANKSREG